MKKILFVLSIILLLFSFNEVKAIEVSSFEELKDAITNTETEIKITDDFDFSDLLTITYNVTIDGDNHKLTRSDTYLKGLFAVKSGSTLTLSNLLIDGKAPGWEMDIENRFYTNETRSAYVRFPSTLGTDDLTASATLINNAGSLVLNNVSISNIFCTVTGCAIYGAGNNAITNSTFTHVGSSKNGGVIYIPAGSSSTVISGSTFKDNASGVSVTTSTQGGAIYVAGGNKLETKENTLFENNLAQNNGGALYIVKVNTLIENTTFKENKVGNDGSAITFSAATGPFDLVVQDILFEGNYGYASRAQSLGVIWLQKWVTAAERPILFKNLTFTKNVSSTGLIADNGSDATTVIMENINAYENTYKAAALYFQGVNVTVNGLNVHDNTCLNDYFEEDRRCRGMGVYAMNASPMVINNAIINNNDGGGIAVIAGDFTINDSEITNNRAIHANGGGGILVMGSYPEYMVDLKINNTVIANNSATTYGGGISVADNEDVFSSITVDNQSKIYDNTAIVSGDDFAYRRVNDSENTTTNTITLDNISIAGIMGIDGWYNDPEDDRYVNNNNPSIFNDYVDYNGSGLYLKAGGLNDLDYDLVDGENDDITPVVIQYGVPYVVTDEEPEKEGFTFVNWNTKPDGSGTTLTSGDSYDGSEGYILYAIYDENEYTVNYNLQGGSNDKIVSVTNLYTKPFVVTSEVPEKDGYKFIEWNTKADGTGMKLKGNDTYDRSDGFTLYAIYEEIEEEPTPDIPQEEKETKPEEKEEEIPVPKTSDNINKYIIMVIISALVIIGSYILYRKNKIENN